MKTTYEKWIEANTKLFACFEGTSQASWEKLAPKEQESLCFAEKEAVSSFLKENQVGFANILKERIHALQHAEK